MKKIFTQSGFTLPKLGKALQILAVMLFLLVPFKLFAGTISGTFTTLTNCPMNLTCFTVDPTTGIFYGQGDQNSTNYYSYNTSTSAWTLLTACPQSSGNNGGATYLNGKIYNSYCSHSNMTVYDIATNTWSTISGGITTGCISNDGTNVYVSGGSEFKKYVVATSTWVSLSSLTYTDNSWGGLQYKNGYFYHHSGNGNTPFDRYNVATDTWTTLTNVPGGAVLGSAIFDAYYYCQGPYYGTNLYSYDLGAGEWNNTLTLPFTTDDAAIVTYNNSLYIVQGEAGTGFTKFTPNNPILTAIEGTALSYNIGDAAVNITSTLVASQNAGTNFQSATVTIASGFQTGKDVLSFVNAYSITGSWSAATGVLTLTGTTTIANYQAALRSVKYINNDLTSNNATRTISFKVYDGAIYSNTASRNITIPPQPPLTPTSVTANYNPICNGASTTLTANGAIGTVYWYNGSCGGASGSIATGNTLTVSPSTTTTYYARNYNNGFYSAMCVSISIVVNPRPTVADLVATGTGLKWYLSSSGGTALETTTQLLNNTHYYASQTVNGVESTARFDVLVTMTNP